MKKDYWNKSYSLQKAKSLKRDEFYTTYSDIERELVNYKDFLKGKVIYCPCDNPNESQFVRFFKDHFSDYGLKKVIASCYNPNNILLENGSYCEITEDNCDKDLQVRSLKSDGDFRSQELERFYNECDVIITNPPFSLFKEFYDFLIKTKKKFLFIGNITGSVSKNVFNDLRNRRSFFGVTSYKTTSFTFYDNYENKFVKFGNCCWFTNINHGVVPEPIKLTEEYNPEKYPTYFNFKAIECSKVRDIPKDYDGVIGVPQNFLFKWNPNQFEILAIARDFDTENGIKSGVTIDPETFKTIRLTLHNPDRTDNGKHEKVQVCHPLLEGENEKGRYYLINGKKYHQTFARIFIRRKI